MAETKIFIITNRGLPTGIAKRVESEAIEYVKDKYEYNYIRGVLHPKPKKHKAEVVKVQHSHDAREVLRQTTHLFPESVIKSLTEKQAELWIETVRKFHDIDGYSYQEIQEVIEFGRKDDFWSDQFLSISPLRTRKSSGDVYKFEKIKSAMYAARKTRLSTKDRQIASSASDIADFISQNS